MKNLAFIFSLTMMILFSSCGDNSSFKAEGTIDDGITQNMRVIYYDNETINLLTIKVNEGAFEFKAKLTAPTMLEFYSANKSLLGRAFVEPGDKLECVLYKNSPYKANIKGNDVSERWSKFLNDNIETIAGGNAEKINSLVTKYIQNNKADLLSTLLLLTEYISPKHEADGMTLLSTIAPEARPQYLIESYESLLEKSTNIKANERISMTSFYSNKDSLSTFVPHESSYAIVAFSNNDTRSDGVIADSLRSLRKAYHKKRLQLVDISFDTDTTVWKKSIENDSATWVQGWVVGAASAHSIERLGINRLPFFIIADSTGKQLYRGPSVDSVTHRIDELLNAHKAKEKKN